jgi:hypothetical protein
MITLSKSEVAVLLKVLERLMTRRNGFFRFPSTRGMEQYEHLEVERILVRLREEHVESYKPMKQSKAKKKVTL